MNPPPRRVATTPSLSLKRKETDHFRPAPVLTKSLKPPPPRNGSAHASKSTLNRSSYTTAAPIPQPAQFTQAAKPNNLILAGYMAHEFLTKGTILGEHIDQARAVGMLAGPSKSSSVSTEPSRLADERYVEVASLLKIDGSHIPGIVNPTQLARYLNR